MIGQRLPVSAECTKLCNDRVCSGHATVMAAETYSKPESNKRPPATQLKKPKQYPNHAQFKGPKISDRRKSYLNLPLVSSAVSYKSC